MRPTQPLACAPTTLGLVLMGICAAGMSMSTQANDDFFADVTLQTSAPPKARPLNFTGTLRQHLQVGLQALDAATGFNRNESGLSQLRTVAQAEISGELGSQTHWQLGARSEWEWIEWMPTDTPQGEPHWHAHNHLGVVEDAYLDTTFQNGLWLRLGNQIVAWGNTESLAIADVFSRTDLRRPGQQQLQDIREPLPALMASLPFAEQWQLQAVLTVAAGHHRYAEPGDEFNFFTPFAEAGLSVVEQSPDKPIETGILLRRQYNGGEFALISARVNDNGFYVSQYNLGNQTLTLAQARQSVTALTLSHAFGNVLFKTEVGHITDTPVALDNNLWHPLEQVRYALGLEYSGWNNVLVTGEWSGLDSQTLSDAPTDDTDYGYVLRVRHTGFNERWTNQWWSMQLTDSGAVIHRWDSTFDINDQWNAELNAVFYQMSGADPLFRPFEDHDVINASVSYHF